MGISEEIEDPMITANSQDWSKDLKICVIRWDIDQYQEPISRTKQNKVGNKSNFQCLSPLKCING